MEEKQPRQYEVKNQFQNRVRWTRGKNNGSFQQNPLFPYYCKADVTLPHHVKEQMVDFCRSSIGPGGMSFGEERRWFVDRWDVFLFKYEADADLFVLRWQGETTLEKPDA